VIQQGRLGENKQLCHSVQEAIKTSMILGIGTNTTATEQQQINTCPCTVPNIGANIT
jgi:hypothetical protein